MEFDSRLISTTRQRNPTLPGLRVTSGIKITAQSPAPSLSCQIPFKPCSRDPCSPFCESSEAFEHQSLRQRLHHQMAVPQADACPLQRARRRSSWARHFHRGAAIAVVNKCHLSHTMNAQNLPTTRTRHPRTTATENVSKPHSSHATHWRARETYPTADNIPEQRRDHRMRNVMHNAQPRSPLEDSQRDIEHVGPNFSGQPRSL